MEGKTKGYLFTISSLAVVIIIFGYLNVAQEVQNAPGDLQDCNVINYNPESDFNIVFVGSLEESNKYAKHLFQTPPHVHYKSSINIFNVPREPGYELYKGIAVLANKETIKLAAACPNPDVVVALVKEGREIRASTLGNRITLNDAIPQLSVWSHEMGHYYGLQEEYIADSKSAAKNKDPNCKKDPAEFDIYDEMLQGCTNPNLYRSVDGVMKTLSSDYYGKFNEREIISKIEEEIKNGAEITGRAIDISNECADQKFILLDVNENKIEVYPGCRIDNAKSAADQFKYQLFQDGQIIVDNSLSTALYTDNQEHGQETISGETYDATDRLLITLPYPPQGDTIRILDSVGNIISESSLQEAGALTCAV